MSPIEIAVHDDRLFVGMMPGSTKQLDVERDPRIAIVTALTNVKTELSTTFTKVGTELKNNASN